MADSIKTTLAILGILGLMALAGTIDYNADPPNDLGIRVEAYSPVTTLERWCEDNPHRCDPADYKRSRG